MHIQSNRCRHVAETLEGRLLFAAPTLAFSSYLGGSNNDDYGTSIAVDAAGNGYVTGRTAAINWTVGGFDTSYNGGAYDAFVAKINANGTFGWSTYIGGTEEDRGEGIAVDASGNVWVVGNTNGGGWATGGFDTSFNGDYDAFVAKINANGTLAFSSFLGGTTFEDGADIAIGAGQSAWIIGGTGFGNGVVAPSWASGGFDTSYNGGAGDAFLTNVSADGTAVLSSYLGGNRADSGSGIAVDSQGNPWVAGATDSIGWTVGGFDTTYNDIGNGNGDAFVAKINANNTLAWSSYLGGATGDVGTDVAIDAAGNGWVTGSTLSSGWVAGGFDTTLNGADGFVAKVNADATLAFTSYIGGNGDDNGQSIATDSTGNAFVSGGTFSSGFAVGGFDNSYGNNGDAFVARINAGGTFGWSSYLGGSGFDAAKGVATDLADKVWVTGETTSSGWTVGGFDTTYNGGGDAFLAKINDADLTAPQVTTATFSFEVSPNSVSLQFTENVSASLVAADLVVSPAAGGPPVSITNYAYNAITNTATFELATPLADDNYRAVLPAGSVNDVAGNLLAAEFAHPFYVFAGDANRDRSIDLSDFSTLASRFNLPGTFSQGDFNYSGVTEIGDFSILASKFNTTLPPARVAIDSTVYAVIAPRAADYKTLDRHLQIFPPLADPVRSELVDPTHH